MSPHGRVVEITIKYEDRYEKRLAQNEIALCVAVLGAECAEIPGQRQGPADYAQGGALFPPGLSAALPFYVVFYNDRDNAVHTTSAYRIWSEAVDDAVSLAEGKLAAARRFEVFRWTREGVVPAPQRGSSRVRARTRWHITD